MADAAMPSTGDTTSGHRFVSGHRFASMAGAVLLSAMALAACGESAQDKAKAEICTARDEISKQVTKLQGLTISSNTGQEVKGSVEAIGDQLKKIKNAESDLEPDGVLTSDFAPFADLAAVPTAARIAVADIDGDGKVDLIASAGLGATRRARRRGRHATCAGRERELPW